MAKKKRKGLKKSNAPKPKPKSSSRSKSPAPGLSGIPDRRVLEGLMRDFLGGMVGGGAETPLGQAQKILDEAFASDDRDLQVALARKALEASADCADAYVLLAENAAYRQEALE